MTDTNKEACFYASPGKLQTCSILSEPCICDERCTFRKTEREVIIARNRAVILNRKRGNCAKCKYKQYPCDLIPIGDDKEI